MKGPIPKPSSMRQRGPRVSTRALLSPYAKNEVPTLPDVVGWKPQTLAWWNDVWRSPMASEYLRADAHGLLRLAVLINNFWERPSTKLSAEIRREEAEYGLSPVARRRLQWEIQKIEKVTRKRQAVPGGGIDPREMLRHAR